MSDVLDTLHDCALRLRTKGCTEFAADLDKAAASVAMLVTATKKLVEQSVHPYDGGEYEDGEWPALDAARFALGPFMEPQA